MSDKPVDMRILLISIFAFTLFSCSVSKLRKPSSMQISSYEEDGTYFVELDLVLTKARKRVDFPDLKIKSIDYSESKLSFDVYHNEDISCYDGLRGNQIVSCALNSNKSSVVKLVYSFKKTVLFPVHEVSWKEQSIKSKFSNNEILKSKILKKMNAGRGLFLPEKLLLLKEYAQVESVDLSFPRKKNLRFDNDLPEMISIDSFGSSLKHKTLGEIPIKGLMKSDFLGDRFYAEDLNPFEFFCKSKNEIYGIDQDMIVIESIESKQKITCLFNNKYKKIFSRVNVKGSTKFSIRYLYLDQAFEKLKAEHVLMEGKLKKFISSIDKSNIDIIQDALMKLQLSK